MVASVLLALCVVNAAVTGWLFARVRQLERAVEAVATVQDDLLSEPVMRDRQASLGGADA